MLDNHKRYCDRCGVELTKKNNKCGYELCDKCNEDLEKKLGRNISKIEQKMKNAKETTWLTDGLTDKEVEEAINKGKKLSKYVIIIEELEKWYKIISNMDERTYLRQDEDTTYGYREKLFAEGKEEILDMLRNRIGELKDGRI